MTVLYTYTIDPDYVYAETVGRVINVLEFESGKEKRIMRGSARRRFSLKYDMIDETKMDSILDFFNITSGALQTFYWTNPLDDAKYTCRLSGDEIDISNPAHDQYNVSVSFVEDI